MRAVDSPGHMRVPFRLCLVEGNSPASDSLLPRPPGCNSALDPGSSRATSFSSRSSAWAAVGNTLWSVIALTRGPIRSGIIEGGLQMTLQVIVGLDTYDENHRYLQLITASDNIPPALRSQPTNASDASQSPQAGLWLASGLQKRRATERRPRPPSYCGKCPRKAVHEVTMGTNASPWFIWFLDQTSSQVRCKISWPRPLVSLWVILENKRSVGKAPRSQPLHLTCSLCHLRLSHRLCPSFEALAATVVCFFVPCGGRKVPPRPL